MLNFAAPKLAERQHLGGIVGQWVTLGGYACSSGRPNAPVPSIFIDEQAARFPLYFPAGPGSGRCGTVTETRNSYQRSMSQFLLHLLTNLIFWAQVL